MKMRIIIKFLLTLFLIISFVSCENDIVENTPKDYTADFDSVWTNYDKYYPLFTYKNIDWHQVKIDFQDKFKNIYQYQRNLRLASMLSILKDEHTYININSSNPIQSYTDNNAIKNYNKNFLTKFKSSINWVSVNNFWGWGKKENIGYIAFRTFQPFDVDSLEFDLVLENLKYTDGIIIDIRENYGGSPFVISAIANRFTNKTISIGYYLYRNGPNHDDFGDPITVATKPRGSWQYQKKVAVLIGNYTFSAGEIFAEAFEHFEDATLIGDTTRGAGNMAINKNLSDGDTYMLPVAAFYNNNGQPLEWNGVCPEIYIDSEQIVDNENRDIIIEKAIEILK